LASQTVEVIYLR